jgi:hypothetical protein
MRQFLSPVLFDDGDNPTKLQEDAECHEVRNIFILHFARHEPNEPRRRARTCLDMFSAN